MEEVKTVDVIHVYKDGNQWCAIYPMFSDLMSCEAVAFSPINVKFNESLGRERDYGKYDVLAKLKSENKKLETHRFYSEYWD